MRLTVIAAEDQVDLDVSQTSGPTVFPVDLFDPDEDCVRLEVSVKGMGTDKKVMLAILPKRSNDQRQELKTKYQEKFKKDLQNDLESELTGDFEELVLAMMSPPLDYDCHCLHEAVKGLGTDERMLTGILCTRTTQELSAIKERYKELYDTDLKDDIARDTSGGLVSVLLEVLQCQRPEGDAIDVAEATEDAKKLVQVFSKESDIVPETDETLTAIITQNNLAQTRLTFDEYKKMSGQDIYSAMAGDTKDVYKSLAMTIDDPVQFYTERLGACFEGLGTNDAMLIYIVVSRSEVDLEDIKSRYISQYNHTVQESIESECSGDYKNLLLAIVGDK